MVEYFIFWLFSYVAGFVVGIVMLAVFFAILLLIKSLNE